MWGGGYTEGGRFLNGPPCTLKGHGALALQQVSRATPHTPALPAQDGSPRAPQSVRASPRTTYLLKRAAADARPAASGRWALPCCPEIFQVRGRRVKETANQDRRFEEVPPQRKEHQ